MNKRENFREAMDAFDLDEIAAYEEEKIAELLQNKGIIRNRLKIRAAIQNARIFKDIVNEFGSFLSYLKQFWNGKTIYEKDVTFSPLSDAISKGKH